jgi:hypothetical protein
VSSFSFVSMLGLRRRQRHSPLGEADYRAAGQRVNEQEFRRAAEQTLFRLWQEEDSFDWLLEVPFAFQQLVDLHAAMRHAVAVAGERPEALTQQACFHSVFAAFALGFGQGLVVTHRGKHLRWHGRANLSPVEREECERWGVDLTTYYLAAVDAHGIFGKVSDIELYGIADNWWLLGNSARVEGVNGIRECVEAGRRAAGLWAEDEHAVARLFTEALAAVARAE